MQPAHAVISSASRNSPSLASTFTPQRVVAAGLEAARVIRSIFEQGDLGVVFKDDASPVTRADEASNSVLKLALADIDPALYCSEEEIPELSKREKATRIWLVDPLDNTKGLVNGHIESCGINIALIDHGDPLFGYIHYFGGDIGILGIRGEGAFIAQNGELRPLEQPVLPINPRFVSYRPDLDTMNASMRNLHERLGVTSSDIVHGAILPARLHAIISGAADIYIEPRSIREWDVAPAFAIIRAQGGEVYSLADGKPCRLGSSELRAHPFVAVRRGIQAEETVKKLIAEAAGNP
jgi:3'(2'), 5'-bisphosphate nucleotidase